jgi:hypothetical protein
MAGLLRSTIDSYAVKCWVYGVLRVLVAPLFEFILFEVEKFFDF